MAARPPLAVAARAALVAVAAAEAAAVALRPRLAPPRPLPVAIGEVFTAAEVARGRAFQRPQLAVSIAARAVTGAVLAALARRPPRMPGPPPLAGAATAALTSLA